MCALNHRTMGWSGTCCIRTTPQWVCRRGLISGLGCVLPRTVIPNRAGTIFMRIICSPLKKYRFWGPSMWALGQMLLMILQIILMYGQSCEPWPQQTRKGRISPKGTSKPHRQGGESQQLLRKKNIFFNREKGVTKFLNRNERIEAQETSQYKYEETLNSSRNLLR